MDKIRIEFAGKLEVHLRKLVWDLCTKSPVRIGINKDNIPTYLESIEKAVEFVDKMIEFIRKFVGTEKEWQVKENSFYGNNRFGISYNSLRYGATWYIIYTKHPRLKCYKIRRILNSSRLKELPYK